MKKYKVKIEFWHKLHEADRHILVNVGAELIPYTGNKENYYKWGIGDKRIVIHKSIVENSPAIFEPIPDQEPDQVSFDGVIKTLSILERDEYEYHCMAGPLAKRVEWVKLKLERS